jgi:GMP synthase-like glutamine amidotransferase
MLEQEKRKVRVAILDLYDGYANQGMRGFQDILQRYKKENNIDLSYKIYDVRNKAEVPGTEYDIYISSGGPGSPLASEGSEWENKYFDLIEKLEAHNASADANKKYVLFVCHSFQLICRKYKLGEVCLRKSPSFGIYPVYKTATGNDESILEGLADPFYIADSRKWQVIKPDMKRFQEIGATLLVLEKERPHIPLEPCLMAIRFSEYFFGTQFHPEADPEGMKAHLLTKEKKQEVIDEHGQEKYDEMMELLNDPDKLALTQSILIPNFLNQAIHNLQEA